MKLFPFLKTLIHSLYYYRKINDTLSVNFAMGAPEVARDVDPLNFNYGIRECLA